MVDAFAGGGVDLAHVAAEGEGLGGADLIEPTALAGAADVVEELELFGGGGFGERCRVCESEGREVVLFRDAGSDDLVVFGGDGFGDAEEAVGCGTADFGGVLL